MRIGLLILVAIIFFSGAIYSASLGVVLFKNNKKTGSAVLWFLTIIFIVLPFSLLKAI